MTRTITLIATGLTTLALSACGTAATTTSSPNKPAAAPITQTQTPAQAHAGFFNMTTLRSDIVARTSKRMADPTSPYYRPGVTVVSSNAIQSGPRSATFLDTLSDGMSYTTEVTISADGQTYITH